MGEYFAFVNHDKKERIDPLYFDMPVKAHAAKWKGNALLQVLRTLLAHEWKGDRIEWDGDDYFEEYYEFTEKSAFFKCADRNEVNQEVNFCMENGRLSDDNEFGLTDDNLNELFTRDVEEYKYTINYTKKVAYSLEETKILSPEGEVLNDVDPLYFLIGIGRTLDKGEWVGDIIGVSNKLDPSITLLEEITID